MSTPTVEHHTYTPAQKPVTNNIQMHCACGHKFTVDDRALNDVFVCTECGAGHESLWVVAK